MEEIIGSTPEVATKVLKSLGITNITVTPNYQKALTGSVLLVTSCKIDCGSAHLTVGSFLLNK